MHKQEIKARIDFLNNQIQSILNPSKYTLNNVIVELSREIESLQAQCEHELDEDGYCIWCNKYVNKA